MPVYRPVENPGYIVVKGIPLRSTDNACSKLYGACCRIGFDMGYERIVTYTLATESGASLRAAGYTPLRPLICSLYERQ